MSDLNIDLKLSDIERHKQRHGPRKTAQIMSRLGKKHKFVEAVKTPVGEQLLKDMMVRMDDLLEKNLRQKMTDRERIEYEVLEKLSETWISRIYSYLQTANLLTEEPNVRKKG
ncbi:MAG: hypothetical protein ACYS17_12860 [Planctomycetota bacterium]|jgi:hypothetical protein